MRSPQISYLVGSSPMCSQIPGLSSGQTKLCQLYQDHMSTVVRGGRASLSECQWQFRNRRWNCSTLEGFTIFGPKIEIGMYDFVSYHFVPNKMWGVGGERGNGGEVGGGGGGGAMDVEEV